MEQRLFLERLQNTLAPLSTEQLLRKNNDLDTLALLIPISNGSWKIRMEICVLEIEPGLGIVEYYSTLQENMTDAEAYSGSIADWNRDSFGTYGIFRQDETVSLFHRHMNVVETRRPLEKQLNLAGDTVLVILHELDRRVPELKSLAQPTAS